MIERLQDLDLLLPALEDLAVVLLQSLDRHALSRPVVGRVVQVEGDLSEVTLRTRATRGGLLPPTVTGRSELRATWLYTHLSQVPHHFQVAFVEDAGVRVGESLAGGDVGICERKQKQRHVSQDRLDKKKTKIRHLRRKR